MIMERLRVCLVGGRNKRKERGRGIIGRIWGRLLDNLEGLLEGRDYVMDFKSSILVKFNPF